MFPYEIKGQCVAKRAFEVAHAGGLGVLLVGPLGSGKTTLREAFPGTRSAEREPCACGHFGDVRHECVCNPVKLARWRRRLERDARGFEIVLDACAVPVKEMMAPNHNTAEDDAHMWNRITAAQLFGMLNTTLELTQDSARRTMEMAARRLSLTYAQYNAVLRVARVIANLDRFAQLQARHVAEAVQYSAACAIRQ